MKLNFDLSALLKSLPLVKMLVALQGDAARDSAERILTIPEHDVRAVCKGMTEADTALAVQCFRDAADRLSDGLALIASRGQIQPD